MATVPDFAAAIRNGRYKLVVSQLPDCSGENANANPPVDVPKSEFYEIDEKAPVPKLDNAEDNLLLRPNGLSRVEQRNFDRLMSAISSAYLPGTSGMRSLSDSLHGRMNPHLSAAMKLTTSSLTQEFSEMAMEVLEPYATLMDDPRSPSNGSWVKQYLGDRSMTIAGRTSEVQRNIIAQRILGLLATARRSADHSAGSSRG